MSSAPGPGVGAKRVLITGGAGFIGSSLALDLAARHPGWEVVALDNLHRRGSELNLHRLRECGVSFVHGDVREPDDLRSVGPFDALVECAAEPSVMAGIEGSRSFLVRTNLLGTHHCLEESARHGAQFIFLSTSRVYPVRALNSLLYTETDSRFELAEEQPVPGASRRGITEEFPLGGARTLYGASKLGSELLVTEYADGFGLPTVVNRCGVVAGPWQMGKVDQGVFTHWIASFHFGRPLTYLGFGAAGKQVRDLLHVLDLADLIDDQLLRPAHWAGAVVNVGGGREVSLSLRETTELCREITGHDVAVGADPRTRPGDVPIYLSDCRALAELTDWAPRRDARQVLTETHDWIRDNEDLVAGALASR